MRKTDAAQSGFAMNELTPIDRSKPDPGEVGFGMALRRSGFGGGTIKSGHRPGLL